MVSLSLGQQLKEFGLVWQPRLHDFFAVPGRDMDDRVFVITDIQAYLELYHQLPVVTFHGVAEWALDYILQTEVVWLPTQAQLQARLGEFVPEFTLMASPAGYTCTIQVEGDGLSFGADRAADAYGEALLFCLMHEHKSRDGH
jgi:hypothetical protein